MLKGFSQMSQLPLMVVLLNAPFWILSSHEFVSRALISIDSLLIVILLERSLGLGLIALIASWLADITVSAAAAYHFRTPAEFIQSAAYAGDIHWSDFMTSTAVISTLPFIAVLAAIALPPRPRIGGWPILLTTTALIAIDSLNGSSALSNRDVRAISTNVAGSSWHALARAAISSPDDELLSPVPGGMAEAGKYLESALTSNESVLYVIVESFGVHKNPRVRQWMQDQLFTARLSKHYATAYEAVPSRGGTTLGELRRLCGLYGSFRRLTKKEETHCIPGSFAKAGWTTMGMHGFSESMFARRSWWPAMGLQDLRFAEDLSSSVTRRCGAAFRGICDEDLIALAVSQTQHPRHYVYALTLNSHLPVAHIPVSPELQQICFEEHLGDDVCIQLAHVALVLKTLSQQLEAKQTHPYVVLAGDHPPPFLNSQARDQFERESVPFFALLPRESMSFQTPSGVSPPAQPGSAP